MHFSMREHSKLFLVILVAVVIFGCKNNSVEVQPIDMNHLEGKWNIYEAQRDGKKTDLLSNGYVKFDSQNIMHNLLGNEITTPYEIEGTYITSTDQLLDKVKVLKMISDSSVFETTFKNYIFKFKLVKDEK